MNSSDTYEPTVTAGELDNAGDLVEQDIEVLIGQIHRLTDERDQANDNALRTLADFQNYKKRNQQELQLFRQFATENFARELLPVLDNFERTLAHVRSGATIESVLEGMAAVERQLRSALEGQNVRRIESVGQEFDPSVHEALGTESTNEFPEDTVSHEIEPGYKMGDKVIRPARVKVAKRAG